MFLFTGPDEDTFFATLVAPVAVGVFRVTNASRVGRDFSLFETEIGFGTSEVLVVEANSC